MMSREAAEEVMTMPSGGSRPRSGPAPDPTSLRSAKRGLEFKALSPKPYRGKIPEYPLPQEAKVFKTIAGAVLDEAGTVAFRARELALWAQAWRTYPGAHCWAVEPWRLRSVAMWVRVSVSCEALDVPASMIAQMTRLSDEALVSSRGLTDAGYTIAAVAPPAAPRAAATRKTARPAARGRKLALVTHEAS